MATAPDKLLGLSDEDFLKLDQPDAPAADAQASTDAQAGADGSAATETTTTTTEGTGGEAESDKATGTDKTGTEGAEGGGKAEGEGQGEAGKTEGVDGDGKPADEKEKEEPSSSGSAEGDKKKEGEPEGGAGAEGEKKPDGAATGDKSTEGGAASSPLELPVEKKVEAFDLIMKPFKANGKTVELRSPEEAIALMQMGANYTKRMQAIQPHRKVLMMLESNGLLDEGKLSFLIDIDRKDPEAIKKLLKDGGIDPLEIDVSGDPAYVEGSHRISEDEVKFRTTLDELGSSPAGAETLTEINTGWDQASKQVLWNSPEIMTVIHQQREIGVYDVIKAEVDRQMTLGVIPANTPFLQAYKAVGDEMAKAALGDGQGGNPSGATGTGEAKAEPTVVATRTETPKSQVANGDKASAASPTRASPGATGEKQNPLAMSDEAFLKQFDGRL
jgi:hypothetical protein